MDSLGELLDRLVTLVPGGYHRGDEPASEPTAWAGLALCAHGRLDIAQFAANWLARIQASAGSVGVTKSQATPCWPTSLAILLWHALDAANNLERYAEPIRHASSWALEERGLSEIRRPYIGHDTTLVGWSWAEHTHSWLEPTAFFVLALKSIGESQHPRTREAVRLLIDRLLPSGGCNYGNTIVLGQELLPHLQPTGIVMMALAEETTGDPRIDRSLEYLERELATDTATASLSFALLGLAAHNRTPKNRDALLEAAYRRTVIQGPAAYKLALIALAATSYPFHN